MRQLQSRWVILWLLCLLPAVACKTGNREIENTQPTMPQPALEGYMWSLLSYGSPGEPKTTASGRPFPMTLAFERRADSIQTTIHGSAGCNNYFGSVTINRDQRMAVAGQIASTRMLCFPEELMKQENEYLTALRTMERYQIQDSQLQIFYDSGNQVLTFVGTPHQPVPKPTTPSEAEVIEIGP